MLIQQGDVLIESCSIPVGLSVKSDNHLAEGEATGHFHEAVGVGVSVLEGSGDSLFLSVPNGAEVTHQEHGTVKVPAGDYKVRIVREYDHFREEARKVVD